jgi:hypothetical protein
MVFSSYLFTNNIVHTYMIHGVDNVFAAAKAQIEAELFEPKVTLSSFSKMLRDMVLRDEDAAKLRDFINDMSNYIENLDLGNNKASSFSGFICYFETLSEGPLFVSSGKRDIPANYVPTDHAWYKRAILLHGEIAETMTYSDIFSGETVIVFSRCIYDDYGRRLGVIAIRIKMGVIGNFIVETALSRGGYGILVNDDLVIIAHPNKDFVNKSARDPDVPISVLVDEMEKGRNVSE